MTEKTVLIIEDEQDAAELFAEMMRVSGLRVLTIFNTTNALEVITKEKPNLIILDLMMPGISGLEVLHEKRNDPVIAPIPVIIVSAKGTPADIKIGMKAGATTYLTKPVGFLELKEAVFNALGN